MTEHRDDALTGLHHNRPWSWTAEREDELRKLWPNNDLSCSALGTLLGVSRNSIIGKAHRMKLPERKLSRTPKKDPAPGERMLTHARRGDPLRSGLNEGNRPYRPPLDLCEASERVDLPAEQSDCAVDIFALTPEHCHFPLWPTSERSGLYCGRGAHKGLSYCLGHAHVVFQPSQGRRA